MAKLRQSADQVPLLALGFGFWVDQSFQHRQRSSENAACEFALPVAGTTVTAATELLCHYYDESSTKFPTVRQIIICLVLG